ncbi:MarR family transcriptional regulator [Kitasatospora sp. NPDC101155]|uniref:MarR family transcriptional regulator n=1 Tax=Kitasatospora sp. NPDC101155 TaxID=3364097 RepID=UPI00380E16B3
MSNQLSLLNNHVVAQLDLKNVDLDCLDLINSQGPISPGNLARRAGLHPATVTGILDRLQRGGWVTRERDPVDRRAVVVRALRDRNPELLHLYSGMNASLDEICASYEPAQLEVVADFLSRTAEAGMTASAEMDRKETDRKES